MCPVSCPTHLAFHHEGTVVSYEQRWHAVFFLYGSSKATSRTGNNVCVTWQVEATISTILSPYSWVVPNISESLEICKIEAIFVVVIVVVASVLFFSSSATVLFPRTISLHTVNMSVVDSRWGCEHEFPSFVHRHRTRGVPQKLPIKHNPVEKA